MQNCTEENVLKYTELHGLLIYMKILMANPIDSMGWAINWIILDFNNLLEAMIERIDEEETGMRFSCKNCRKKTSNKQSILRHVETHLDMVPNCVIFVESSPRQE